MKRVLTIAGSDSGGGAGIQADLKTFSAHGLYGMSVVTAVTAQNTVTVSAVQLVEPQVIAAQIDAVFEDIGVDAVKVGMLADPEAIEVVVDRLRHWKPGHLVVDPVMFTKSRFPLLQAPAIDALLNQLLPIATIITPNIPEAERLVGRPIHTLNEMELAARELGSKGEVSVLVKGGALKEGNAVDLYYCDGKIYRFSSERFDQRHTHGTGCTLSAAIAANLALGHSKLQSVERAKSYISGAIQAAFPLGKGIGPVNHFYRIDFGEREG